MPTRIETLMATPPEGEPVRNPRTAGTTVNSMIMSKLPVAKRFPKIPEIPALSIVFLSRNAP